MTSLLEQYKAMHCHRKPCAACELEQHGFALACQHTLAHPDIYNRISTIEIKAELEAVEDLAKQEGVL